MTISRAALFALALAAIGCERTATGEEPPWEPPRPPRFHSEALVRYHMQRHFDDLATVQRMLIEGHLDDAKALAFMLAKPETDPGMAPWDRESRAVVEAARGLMAARDITGALQREADVAQACGDCHLRAQKLPVFPPAPRVPPDEPTAAARMARHQWAADRLWEGIVGARDDRWRSGLEVFAAAPPPVPPFTEAPDLALRFQMRAKSALANAAEGTLEDRATAYGDLLVTCYHCHRVLRPKRID
jgi:hypothetical protein